MDERFRELFKGVPGGYSRGRTLLVKALNESNDELKAITKALSGMPGFDLPPILLELAVEMALRRALSRPCTVADKEDIETILAGLRTPAQSTSSGFMKKAGAF